MPFSYNCFNRSLLRRSEILANENWPTRRASSALLLNLKFIILIRKLFTIRTTQGIRFFPPKKLQLNL